MLRGGGGDPDRTLNRELNRERFAEFRGLHGELVANRQRQLVVQV
jgi:hypothetical protein